MRYLVSHLGFRWMTLWFMIYFVVVVGCGLLADCLGYGLVAVVYGSLPRLVGF